MEQKNELQSVWKCAKNIKIGDCWQFQELQKDAGVALTIAQNGWFSDLGLKSALWVALQDFQ